MLEQEYKNLGPGLFFLEPKLDWLSGWLLEASQLSQLSPMSEINGFAIATFLIFFLSTIFVIQPLSFHVPLPFIGRTRVTIDFMTAPILAILILWAAQCIGPTEIRNGIVGTGPIPLILCLFENNQRTQMASNLTTS